MAKSLGKSKQQLNINYQKLNKITILYNILKIPFKFKFCKRIKKSSLLRTKSFYAYDKKIHFINTMIVFDKFK